MLCWNIFCYLQAAFILKILQGLTNVRFWNERELYDRELYDSELYERERLTHSELISERIR